ncbi:hypothetical protein NG99_25405 [Erwinia typographi]|uniref:Uncharacterized protein n=1 Tax=Erwinia typographi TaxID=371042 RepID=A0A0A3YMG5_9GAMM|nr:hypothetical protein NG99_25405 [Erwinia typographi]
MRFLIVNQTLKYNTVLNIEAVAGDGNMDVRMLIEQPAVSMEGTEYPHLNALLTRPLQHGAGGAAKEVIEQRSVIVKERPEQVWHGKGDVLPLAIGQNVAAAQQSTAP